MSQENQSSEDIEKYKLLDEQLDRKYELLNDIKVYDQKYKVAKDYRRGLSNNEIKTLRKLCKTNLFFLCKRILLYDRLVEGLHGHLCTWLDKTRHEKYREILLPRAHFKSTIVTIGGTVQRVLPADEELEEQLQWPWNIGVEGRYMIAHEVATMANGYLYSVTNHMMGNPYIMGLFPEIVPNPRDHKINKSELELPRTKVWNEPTVGTMGVGGRSQGLHYDDFIFDDIIGEKARDSETEMETAKNWFDGTPGFRTKLGLSPYTVVGTRWGPEDIYDHIQDRYGSSLKIYRRAVEEWDEEKQRKVPIFPEEIRPEDLEVLKKNKRVYSAQYENDPQGGNVKFDAGWIRYFQWEGENRVLIPSKDGKRIEGRENVWDMWRVLLVDPAVSGYGGYACTGTDFINRNFVLEAKQLELSAPQWMGLFFELHRKYQFHCIAIEEVLFSELFRHWAETEGKLRNVILPIIPVKTEQQAKDIRVDGLGTYLMSGQILLNPERCSKGQNKLDANMCDLEYQIRKFGAIKQYHILDALAYGKKAWRQGFNPAHRKLQEEENQKRMLDGRSQLTGYSKINYARG